MQLDSIQIIEQVSGNQLWAEAQNKYSETYEYKHSSQINSVSLGALTLVKHKMRYCINIVQHCKILFFLALYSVLPRIYTVAKPVT